MEEKNKMETLEQITIADTAKQMAEGTEIQLEKRTLGEKMNYGLGQALNFFIYGFCNDVCEFFSNPKDFIKYKKEDFEQRKVNMERSKEINAAVKKRQEFLRGQGIETEHEEFMYEIAERVSSELMHDIPKDEEVYMSKAGFENRVRESVKQATWVYRLEPETEEFRERVSDWLINETYKKTEDMKECMLLETALVTRHDNEVIIGY